MTEKDEDGVKVRVGLLAGQPEVQAEHHTDDGLDDEQEDAETNGVSSHTGVFTLH